MGKKILLVDDELQIIKSLRRLFMSTEYETFFALSGKEALQILDQHSVDMVITDMKMPQMDGYQLLTHIKQNHPKPIRLILSGYTEGDTLYKAIQNNLAKMYLFKPWENNNLLRIIDQLFAMEEQLNNEDLLSLIRNTDEIPTVPSLYKKISDLIEKEAGIEEILEAIEEDHIIAAKILKVANSGFYNDSIGSIKKAVEILGVQNIKGILLSSKVMESLKYQTNTFFTREFLWKHSSLTNRIVIEIYRNLMKKPLDKNLESAGLFHDIGKVFLYNAFPERYNQIIGRIEENDQLSFYELEKEYFHFTHMEVGACLLNWWGLPYPIVEAALFSHNPFSNDIIEKELLMAVYIADHYSWSLLRRDIMYRINGEAFNVIGTTKQECDELVETLSFMKGRSI